MKAKDAVIAWTPAGEDRPTAGMVRVGPLLKEGDADWMRPFLFTGGASYAATRQMKGMEAVARVFIEFQTMVVRDGIDPLVAHTAFLGIDEYADWIAGDIPGSNNAGQF